MPAKPKKPLVPSEAEAEIADRIWSAMAGVDSDTTAQVPAQVAASLQYLTEVGTVVAKIRDEQPRLLERYAEDLLAVVNRAVAMTEEDAAMLVMALLSSTTMARILADIANGTVEPIAATPRPRAAKKATARKTAPKTSAPVDAAPEPVEPAPAPVAAVPEPAPAVEPAPAPAKRAAKKAAASVQAAPSPAEPAPEPDDLPPPVLDADATTVPGDFDDLPPVEVPKPAPVPRAPVAVPSPHDQGRKPVSVVGENDF